MYVYLYVYANDISPDEGFSAENTPPMVLMQSFGSVPFGVGLKGGGEGHRFLEYTLEVLQKRGKPILVYNYFCIWQHDR